MKNEDQGYGGKDAIVEQTGNTKGNTHIAHTWDNIVDHILCMQRSRVQVLPLKNGDKRKAEINPLLENCPIKECMTNIGTIYKTI